MHNRFNPVTYFALLVFSAHTDWCAACKSPRSEGAVRQFRAWPGPCLSKIDKLQVISSYISICFSSIWGCVLKRSMWLPVFEEGKGSTFSLCFLVTVCPRGAAVEVVVYILWVLVFSCGRWGVKRVMKGAVTPGLLSNSLQVTSEVEVPVLFTPDLHLGWRIKYKAVNNG